MNYSPCQCFSPSNKKNSKLSVEIRKKTNNEYKMINSYDREKYMKIINDYSKSLAFAPIESEEYAAAMANRSAVLKGLKKFNECILDIDAVLQITKDPEIKFKLLCRKVECLANMNKKNEAKEFFEEALKIAESFTENLKNNCVIKLNNAIEIEPLKLPDEIKQDIDVSNFISDAITWKYNKKYGNHLVANRDIKIGELVLIESFYIGYPTIDNLYILCSNCLNYTFNSIPCNSCTRAVFCSKTCMNESWGKFHESECKIYNYLFRYPESIVSRISFLSPIRFFIIVLKEKGGIENLVKTAERLNKKKDEHKTIYSNEIVKKDDKKFDFCYGLCKVFQDTTGKLLHEYEYIVSSVLLYLVDVYPSEIIKKYKPALKNILIDLLYIFNDNKLSKFDPSYMNVETCSLELTVLGRVLLPTASLLNHSCRPNLSYVFTKNSQCIFFANKPIKKDEQLFHSYIGEMPNYYYTRKEAIMNHHFFICDCIACKQRLDEVPERDLSADKLRLHHFHVKKFLQSMKTVGFVEKYGNRTTDFLQNEAKKMCKAIEKGYSTLNGYDAEIALRHFKQDLVTLYKRIYGPEMILLRLMK